MTILNTPVEFISNLFQGLFGKKEINPSSTISNFPLPLSDEEYLSKMESKPLDMNDMYTFQLMM